MSEFWLIGRRHGRTRFKMRVESRLTDQADEERWGIALSALAKGDVSRLTVQRARPIRITP